MDKEIKILQINLNHCRLAHDLLNMTVKEIGIDIVLIAEPLYNPGNWIYASGGKAAIWVTGLNGINREEDKDKIGIDYAAIGIDNVTFIAIYLQPNIKIDKYENNFKIIIDSIKQDQKANKTIYLGGDFNAKSPAWGSNKLDSKGIIIHNWLEHAKLHPLEPQGGPTFIKNNKTSKIDFLAYSIEKKINIKLSI